MTVSVEKTAHTAWVMSEEEVELVAGGVVPIAAALFISGAKWGAGVAIAALGLYAVSQQ